MSWEYKTLDQLGEVSRGRSKHRPRNDPSLFGGEYPFIQTADVKAANFYITEYDTTYNEKGLAQSKLWHPGTLCITIAANIADTGILAMDACFPDSVMGFLPYEGVADVRFVKYCLGDHEDDTSYKVSNGLKIDVGGRHDKEDIIHRLLDLLPVLFPDQTNTHKYRALTTNLRSINSKLDKLVNSVGGINNEEKFAQKQELVKKLIEVMSLYLPEMLKKEMFFNQVFYSDVQSEGIIDWLNNLLKAA